MISAVNSSPSFKGVVPVRVFIDGLETFDEKLIKSSCRQLSNILAGPSNTEPKLSIIRRFGQYDRDYRVERGFHGFPISENHKNVHPSEFFRCIIERGRTFLITGPQAERLHDLGKTIGSERSLARERGLRETFDLRVAKLNYGRAITNYLNNSRIRMTEFIEAKRRPVTLFINMLSNQKYGLSTFKMKLDNILFQT